jgi:hypothetical protein
MDIQVLNDMVIAGLGVAAAPIIIYMVDVLKVVGKMPSKYAPYAAAGVGIVLGILLSVEIGGNNVMSIMVGVAAGINAGFASVGLHTTSKSKNKDESGADLID